MAVDAALFRRAEELFAAALPLTPQERAVFITTRCGDQLELRVLLEQLLSVHDAGGTFLEPPQVVGELRLQAADFVSPREALLEAGHRIGW